MRNVQEANLAWALIGVAKPYMNPGERNFVFVTVGAGDTFTTIHCLINLVAAKRIPLNAHLLLRIKAWLDSYSSHDHHEQLCRTVEDFLTPRRIQGSAAIRRSRTPPKANPPLAVSSKWRTGRRLPVREADRRALR